MSPPDAPSEAADPASDRLDRLDFESRCDAGSIAESEGLTRSTQPESLDAQRFHVARTIGAGGMGRVELVHDRRLLRDVAWKRGEWLLREARILAQLEHPGIVPVYDMGFGNDGEAYFAMRVVRGRSLAEVLRAADREQHSALARSLQRAAEAVAYAHHRGVVHRDLKPANIMIGDFGEAQVVDWGLASVLSEAAHPIPDSVRQTLAGFEAGRAGTPGFMSPEQEQGLAADRRSDVFGLGKILERIFMPAGTGDRHARRVASSGASPSATSSSARAASGKADARGCALAPELAAIIERATAFRPDDRYPDARAFAADLAQFLDGGRVAAYAYRPGELLRRFVSAYRVPVSIALFGLVLTLGLTAVYVADVGHERALAESAEAGTRSALARSDRMLGRALVGEARRLAQDGARPEAEVLAAHALSLAEDPDARGILSALGETSVALVDRVRAPCTTSEVDPDKGHLLCVAADSVSLYRLGAEASLLWTRRMPVQLARLVAGGVGVASNRQVVAFDRAGNEVLRQRSPINFTRKTEVGGDRVLFESGRTSAMLDLGRLEVKALRACLGTLHSAVELASSGAPFEATLCKDGSLYLWSEHGLARSLPEPETTRADLTDPRDEDAALPPVVTAFSAPEREAVRMASFGDRLIVGTIKGEVAVIERDGTIVTSSALVDGMVRVLAVSPDERFVAVAGEGDPIQIATLPDLARLTSLPRRARLVTWDPTRPGELVTTGTYVERWRLDPSDPERPLSGAHAIGLRDGVTSLDADPSRADRLGVAFGPYGGTVDRAGMSSVEPGLVTAKAATLWGEVLTVVGVYGGSRYTLPSLSRRDAFPGMAVRRTVSLADGTDLVAGYSWIGRVVGQRQETLDTREAYDLSVAPGRRFAVYVRQLDRMLVRVRSGEPVTEDIVVDAFAEAVAISTDGERLYAAHTDEVVVWSALGVLEGLHRADGMDLVEVAVSGDGRFVAAGAREGPVVLWRVGEAEPCARYFDHQERVPALAFTADSRALVSGSWDRTLRIRDLAAIDVPALALVTRLERRYGMDLGEALGRPLR